jgi:recombination protein RecA
MARKKAQTPVDVNDVLDDATSAAQAKSTAQRALDLTLGALNKKIGITDNVLRVGRFGELKALNVESISTGSISLDCAIGVGGLPRGRVIEVYGPESSGKTTLALHVISEAQKLGYVCGFIDVEHSLDPIYAANLGVKMEDVIFSQPDNGDEAMEIVDALVDSGQLAVLVIDSVSALVPRAEMEGDITDNHIGRQARLMSQALRRLVSKCGKTNTMLIFINQIRMKIGVMFGNPETTSGGNALKFYSSVRLDIRRGKPIKTGDEVLGAETTVKVVKNKVAPPFKKAHFNIMFGTGIDKIADVITMATETDIVERSGAWYSYGSDRIGQGMANVVLYMRDNLDMVTEIREKVLAKVLPEPESEE